MKKIKDKEKSLKEPRGKNNLIQREAKVRITSA